MRVKPYIVRARNDLAQYSGAKVETKIYNWGAACGVQFLVENKGVVHDTGPRYRGHDAEGMAARGVHFILNHERLPGGRTGF